MHMSDRSKFMFSLHNTLFSNQVINPQKQKTQKHKRMIHESTTKCAVPIKKTRVSVALTYWHPETKMMNNKGHKLLKIWCVAVLYPWPLSAIVSVNEDEESSIKFHTYVI